MALKVKIVDRGENFSIENIATQRTTLYDKKYRVEVVNKHASMQSVIKIVNENDSSDVILEDTKIEEIRIGNKIPISFLNCIRLLEKIVQKKDAVLHNHLIKSNSQSQSVKIEKLQVDSIKNEVQGDRSYTKKVVAKPDGTLGLVEDVPQTVVNIPENFSSKFTVEHIYPTKIPDRPTFADDLENILRDFRNIEFTPIRRDEWNLQMLDGLGINSQRLDDKGQVSLTISRSDFSNNVYSTNSSFLKLNSQILLPTDKNWVLKFEIERIVDQYNGGHVQVGVNQVKKEMIQAGISTSGYNSVMILNRSGLFGDNIRHNITTYIIKTSSVLTILAYRQGGVSFMHSQRVFDEFGDYRAYIQIDRATNSFEGNVSYKIFD